MFVNKRKSYRLNCRNKAVMYALIKWVSEGEERGKYTPNIPCNIINGFSQNKFENQEYEIKWRGCHLRGVVIFL